MAPKFLGGSLKGRVRVSSQRDIRALVCLPTEDSYGVAAYIVARPDFGRQLFEWDFLVLRP
jgi:hypothetical protein